MDKKPSLNIFRCKIQYVFMVFMYLCLAKSQAQVHTFLHVYRDYGPIDIVEDHKNGYLLMIYFRSLRIDRDGNKLWDIQTDLEIARQTKTDKNNYYLFGSATEVGGFQFKSIDYKGNINKESRVFSSDALDSTITPLDVIYDSTREQFIVCGIKNKYLSYKLQFWIAGCNKQGEILWQNSWYDKGESRYFKRILPNKATGGYLLLGISNEDYDYSEIFTTDSVGKLKTRHFVDSCYHLDTWINAMKVTDIQLYRDSFFLLSAYRSYCNNEWAYYILNKHGKVVRKIIAEYVSFKFITLENGNILNTGGDALVMLDSNFNLLWLRENIFGKYPNHELLMQNIHLSSDGGFYGIAAGESHDLDSDKDLVFVFKTDSLGFIHHTPKYSEWDQPMMLIPNPASQSVRISIPYYYGRVEARFYDVHGHLLSTQTRNDTEPFDISTLPSGLYMVEAVNLETQATRKMKLVVE